MKIKSVLKEFEAQLKPVQSGGATHGKSEWKHYGDDGTYRFKISVRNKSRAAITNYVWADDIG